MTDTPNHDPVDEALSALLSKEPAASPEFLDRVKKDLARLDVPQDSLLDSLVAAPFPDSLEGTEAPLPPTSQSTAQVSIALPKKRSQSTVVWLSIGFAAAAGIALFVIWPLHQRAVDESTLAIAPANSGALGAGASQSVAAMPPNKGLAPNAGLGAPGSPETMKIRDPQREENEPNRTRSIESAKQRASQCLLGQREPTQMHLTVDDSGVVTRARVVAGPGSAVIPCLQKALHGAQMAAQSTSASASASAFITLTPPPLALMASVRATQAGE